MERMLGDLLKVKGVRGVHDLHAWSITQSLRALSAHIVTDDVSISKGGTIKRDINALVLQRYGISHTTLQLEHEECEACFLYCDIAKKHPRRKTVPAGENQDNDHSRS